MSTEQQTTEKTQKAEKKNPVEKVAQEKSTTEKPADEKKGADKKASAGKKAGEKKATRKKVKRNVPVGHCHVLAGFGNVIVTITDPGGDTVAWSSAGHLGFKGSRKGTPFAAQMAAEDAGKKAMEAGMRAMDLYLNGPGAGREPAVRALASLGIKILSMKDVTPIPHNGCRPPKRRRI